MSEKKRPEAEEEVSVYILQDDEGNEHEFELAGFYEKNGNKYYAMIEVGADEKNDEFCEYVILKAVMEDGEENLVTIDDDDEFDDIADYFDDLFASEIDYDQK